MVQSAPLTHLPGAKVARPERPMASGQMTLIVFFAIVAALYFAVCWPLSQLSRSLERRIDADLGIRRHL